MSGFTYLASPYNHPDPAVREQRYRGACHMTALLMRSGRVVFSPIAHSHNVELIGIGERMSGEFWMCQDIPILRHASEMIVLMMDGWQQSEGIKQELEIAEALNIPVSYMEPVDIREEATA